MPNKPSKMGSIFSLFVEEVTGFNFNMHSAISKGQKGVVRNLLRKGANPNERYLDRTPIHLAASKGDVDILKILIDAGAKVDVRSPHGSTPLESAVLNGHLKVVQMIVEHGANIDSQDSRYYTPLHHATTLNRLEIVKYLVEKGADIRAKVYDGSLAIHIAAMNDNREIVELFLNKGLSVDEIGYRGQTPLFYACAYNKLDVVELLAERGANINFEDNYENTPLDVAIAFERDDTVKFLIEMKATQGCRFKRRLINSLIKAVKDNNLNDILKLFILGANANSKNAEGYTPIYYAVQEGHNKALNILLDNQGNPNLDCNGMSPLHYAVKSSNFGIVKTLLKFGAAYNQTSANNSIPLHFAKDDKIKQLLNLINKSFKAVRSGDLDIIDDLTKIKDHSKLFAILNATNKEGKSLINFAKETNHAC